MFFADKLKDYEILDTGDGMKLERWGGITLARPDPQTKPTLSTTGAARAAEHGSSTPSFPKGGP